MIKRIVPSLVEFQQIVDKPELKNDFRRTNAIKKVNILNLILEFTGEVLVIISFANFNSL
jgi:hypothetical protein